MASASVGGLSELRNTLLSLGADIASKNGGPVRSALAKGAKKVRDAARLRAPVSVDAGDGDGESQEKGGRLRDAIVSARDKDPGAFGLTESYVVRVKNGKGRDDKRGAYYWRFVEFGTVKQPARPFLRPTFEEQKEGFAQTFVVDLRKAIASAVRRGGRRNG
jgi:HK97 gp10 family phage protein